ncbi:hypothetical protein COJ85_32425 [Bacillus sp. AFS076308]|nr:hypothetical protein COJ85_32425 [Bacillus sp. AFS076308]PGV49107.1 hypothetical protein COD92_23045 [Bacillus sp. AFS037270]
MGGLRTREGKKMRALSEHESASDKGRQKDKTLYEHGAASDKGRQKNKRPVQTRGAFGQEKAKK